MWETWVWSLGWEDLLGKEMATHSSIFAWIIPWMKEHGELQSMRLRRARHDWATNIHTHTHTGSISLFLLLFILFWETYLKKYWYDLYLSVFHQCSLLWILWFQVLHPLTYFIFVYDARRCSNFILLYVTVQFSQHHSLKRLFSSPLHILLMFIVD